MWRLNGLKQLKKLKTAQTAPASSRRKEKIIMIRSFAKSIENRKILAERIAAITKMNMTYTRAPRFAYEIGAFTVEKDGTLIVGEGAADGVVAVLKSEGLIGEELTATTAETDENSLLGQEDWGDEPEESESEQEAEAEAEAEAMTSESTASEPAEIETAEASEPAEPAETSEPAETAELAENENPAEAENTENVETVPETQGVKAETETESGTESGTESEVETEAETEAETEIEPQETEAEAETETEAENRIDENCLLGTEDWGDETDESDESEESEQAEHAAIDETAETATEAVEAAETNTETAEAAELSQEEQLIAAEQAYEDPLEISEGISEEISELSNRPSMGASEANAEQPQGAGWDTSESSDGRDYDSRIPTGLSMADMTDMTGFTFPLADHTIGSILNIISMIYTRGPLLSKATGGNFGVDKDLMYILREDEEYESKEYLLDFIKEHVQEGDRLDGLTFTPDSLIFSGFPKENVTVTERAVYERLAARMNKIAQIQKKILAKEITEPNEKYTLRIWLVRMGMGGPDFKFDRKVLLRWLSGHTAFRTEADKEKWQARQRARKQRASLGITGTAGMATSSDAVETASVVAHADNASNDNVAATNETPAMSEEPSDSSDVSGKAINY